MKDLALRRYEVFLGTVVHVLSIAACEKPATLGASDGDDILWQYYGGNAGGTKNSPLAQINRNNVALLDVAWMARAGDFQPELFDPYGHRAGSRRENGTPVQPRAGASCGSCHGFHIRFETTPIMWRGHLYVSTPRSRVLALDPETGASRWTFDPVVEVRRRYAEDLTSRGVAVWTDETASADARCAHRVFLATIEAQLYALDSTDGRPCEEFGNRGIVPLNADLGLGGRDVDPSEYSVTSPPAVVGDVVVVGAAVASMRRRDVASGAVRAFDTRTGRLLWSFDPIPRTEHHPAWERWTPEGARMTGGANVWSIISTDAERDLIFLPTGTAAPDFYGGDRPGRNDFANSVVAVRASTGEVVWSFQVVHHDLWDYDVAAQPLVITLPLDGREAPAVVVGTKTGMIFVLDRETGVPLLPVEERPVSCSGSICYPPAAKPRQ